jgi:hypothetical protein
LGARWVATSLQPDHSHTGPPVRARRSSLGFTRILSNIGSNFMTEQYANFVAQSSSLDFRRFAQARVLTPEHRFR